jgi:hypothetical protein
MNQRWRHHCTVYRPAGEVIRTTEYEVALINSDREAKAFVLPITRSEPTPRLGFALGSITVANLSGWPCSAIRAMTLY